MTTLAAQEGRGPPAQLLVHEGEQAIPRAEISLTPCTEELGYLVAWRAGGLHSGPSCKRRVRRVKAATSKSAGGSRVSLQGMLKGRSG